MSWSTGTAATAEDGPRAMLAILAGDLTAAEPGRRSHGVSALAAASGATGLSSPARAAWRPISWR